MAGWDFTVLLCGGMASWGWSILLSLCCVGDSFGGWSGNGWWFQGREKFRIYPQRSP